MPRKIDARELLAALGGLLVLLSLFLNWYGVGDSGRGRSSLVADGAITGWRAFESLDLVLAALAVLAIATGARALGTVAALGARTLLPTGIALLVIVVVQLVSPPPAAWNAALDTGAWVALAGAVLVATGGLLRALRIDITVNVGARDAREARPRVPAVDRRPTAATAPAAAPAPAPASSDESTVAFEAIDEDA